MVLSKIRVLRSHGRQAIPDLRTVELPDTFRGRPVISGGMSEEESAELEAMCPSGAIVASPLTIRLDRCIFCNECAKRFPRAIRFTSDYRLATNDLDRLSVRVGSPEKITLDENRVRGEIRRYFGRSLRLREVSAGGDNSTEMELNATMNVNFDFARYGVEFTASPRHADGVVVSGPVTANMAEALEICYDAVAEPKILVACGSEACSGGLFADSRAVDRTFFDTHTPDLWLPGAPTHPMTYIDGMMNLLGRKTRQ